MSCPAVEILMEIRDRLRNLDTLEERRRKNRERMSLKRKADKVVCAQESVCAHKEEEKGKENLPPAPPIEKSEKVKKGAGEGEGARAREGGLGGLGIRNERLEMVRAYNEEIGGNVDAEYFVDYYADHWPRSWKARLRNWLKENKKSGRIKLPVAEATCAPLPVAVDWTLCAERCANCRGDGCACGITMPPSCEPTPRPPEECVKFRMQA